MLKILQSPQFVHSLAILHDSLKEVALVSESSLQSETCNLPRAYSRLNTLIRALKPQKGQNGVGSCYSKFKSENDEFWSFCGIALEPRGTFLNKNLFLQSLGDNMESRLEGAVASGARHDADKALLKELLMKFDCLDPEKWPSGVESPWFNGEQRLKKLCEQFNIPFTHSILIDFRDYVDNPSITSPSITLIKSVVNTLPVSSSECERGFSLINNICTDRRNKLTVAHISEPTFLSLVGPPLSKFKPESYVKAWFKQDHRSADDM